MAVGIFPRVRVSGIRVALMSQPDDKPLATAEAALQAMDDTVASLPAEEKPPLSFGGH